MECRVVVVVFDVDVHVHSLEQFLDHRFGLV
jgi:hypothetical protein